MAAAESGTDFLEPPRPVPFPVRTAVLFGGVGQIGWLVLGVGGIFFWALGMNSDYVSALYFRGDVGVAEGVVLGSRETHFSVGGSSRSRGTPVCANTFRYRVGGRTYRGVSYATGTALQKGERVEVEYCAGRPDVARIRGMRSRPLPLVAGLIAVVFPLVGLGLAGFGVVRGVKALRLLSRGHFALGELRSKEATGVQVNNKPVYKMTFEFTARNGKVYTVSTKTHQPERLEDEAQELLLYDADKPEEAILLDNLTGKPTVDETGRILCPAPLRSLAKGVVPLVSLLGHGGFVYWKFFS